MVGNNLIEKKLNSDLFKPKLVQIGDSGLLKKQSVNNQLLSLNFAWSNDISVNLITGVNFFMDNTPQKLHRSPSAATFHFLVIIQRTNVSFRMSFHSFTLDFLIFLLQAKWSNECFRSIERQSKQKGGIIEKRKKKERGRRT